MDIKDLHKDFCDFWKQAVCDAVNRLRYQKRFPNKVCHHNQVLPNDMLKDIKKYMRNNFWANDGYKDWEIVSCANYLWEQKEELLDKYLYDFQDIFCDDDLYEAEMLVDIIGEAISYEKEPLKIDGNPIPDFEIPPWWNDEDDDD